jgi:hypothetical protein
MHIEHGSIFVRDSSLYLASVTTGHFSFTVLPHRIHDCNLFGVQNIKMAYVSNIDKYFFANNHYTSLYFGCNFFQLLVVTYLICSIMAHGCDEKIRSGPEPLKVCLCVTYAKVNHGNKADSFVTYQRYFMKAAQLTSAHSLSEEKWCGI